MLHPAGEDLGHKILELGKHGTAGRLEHGGMELHVQLEELLLLSALTGRLEPRCLRFDRAAEFVEGLELLQPVGRGQPPAEQPGVVQMPRVFGLHTGAAPPAGFHHAF